MANDFCLSYELGINAIAQILQSIQKSRTAKCTKFSKISAYSDFIHWFSIEILGTYTSITSSQSHIDVHRRNIYLIKINKIYIKSICTK